MTYPWQKQQWQQLTQAFLQNRLSHAYLLSGVSGLGKTDFSTAIAALLLCENRDNHNVKACGHCKGCQLFLAQTHPDFIKIMPHEKNHAIKIDQVRTLTQQLTQKSQRGGYQVVVISPADAMPVGAANALLKTLEEPLGNVVIFLVSDCSARLPGTIISRCQQLHFSAENNAETQAWLSAQISSNQDACALLSLAANAPLKAVALALEDYLGLRDAVITHLWAILEGNQNPIAPVASWTKKQAVDNLFYALLTIALDLSRIQLGVMQGLLNNDRVLPLQKMAPHLSTLHLQYWIEKLLDKKRLVARGLNLNAQLLFEDLLLQWYAIKC